MESSVQCCVDVMFKSSDIISGASVMSIDRLYLGEGAITLEIPHKTDVDHFLKKLA